MSIAKIQAARLREVVLDGRWVANTNFKEQLSDLSLEQAQQTPSGFNSIAALTFHIYYYLDGVLNVLHGGELEIRDKYSFDMPALKTEADWQALQNKLYQCAEAYAQQLEQLTGEQLLSGFVRPEYGTWLRNMEGMIEHCYYHLGQVVLIKKMLSN